MKVLLLCDEELRTPEEVAQALDQQVEQLWSRKLSAMAVLGRNVDEVLRLSRHLKECDFIFDPEQVGATLLSNLLHGSSGIVNFGFAMPLNARIPERSIFDRLHQAYVNGTDRSIFFWRPYYPVRGMLRAGFPIFMGPKGLNHLKQFASLDLLEELDPHMGRLPVLERTVIELSQSHSLA